MPERRLPFVTRLALRLSYSKPLSWHPLAARLMGVRIEAADSLSLDGIKKAESDSVRATKYLLAEIVLGVLAVVALPPLILSAGVLLTIAASGTGHTFPDSAFLVIIVALYVALMTPIGALGHTASKASASGVSLALRLARTGERPDLSAYPRMEYVLTRFLPERDGGA